MSELRQDPVSGDWIILAPERARRPHTLVAKEKPKRRPSPRATCPFEPGKLMTSGNWPPILSSPNDKAWRVIAVPNKYPALKHSAGCAVPIKYGLHHAKTGAGMHDLVITRDHFKNLGELTLERAVEVFLVLQKRYGQLAKDKCNIYTAIFFNWGSSAGASVYHPHFQVLTLPIIPPDVSHSLKGSQRYFRKHKRCVHCDMLRFDIKEKKRVLDENGCAVSVAPYVSRSPFEVRVFPKRHRSHFERTPEREIRCVTDILRRAIKRIKRNLRDPDFNFFIHTAPLKDHKYDYYHWHIEIIPKVTMLGGFELSTGVEINVVDPEGAAQILKSRKRT